MKLLGWIGAGLLAGSALAVACSDADWIATSRTSASASSTGMIIGKVRTRDHVLTVLATGSGPRIDIATSSGTVLAQHVGPEDLDRYVPGLGEAYRNGIAGLDGQVDGMRLRDARPNDSIKIR
jgi:hypothetical protein